MAKTPKKRKTEKNTNGSELQRRELRFSTSTTFMPLWVAVAGMMGSLLLGAGIFGIWILNPPLSWASYLVALGGGCLGVALWFAQASESAVIIGDAGVGVEDGQETVRVPWYVLRSVHVAGGSMVFEGDGNTLRFSIGANKRAASYALKEASERVPDIMDVETEFAKTLPDPKNVGGYAQDVVDDQVAGTRCASSNKLIHLEEDARICPQCAQVFQKDSVPEECPSCGTKLKGRTLLP